MIIDYGIKNNSEKFELELFLKRSDFISLYTPSSVRVIIDTRFE